MKLKKINKVKHNHYGFTLIELMIVVVIIAILVTVAYPSYQDSVRKTRRADGKALLLEAVQKQERHFTQYMKYAINLNSGAADTNLVIGVDSENEDYELSFSGTPSATAYTFIVTAQDGQASDSCGNLTLNSLGVKGYKTGGVDCW